MVKADYTDYPRVPVNKKRPTRCSECLTESPGGDSMTYLIQNGWKFVYKEISLLWYENPILLICPACQTGNEVQGGTI